MPTSKGGLRPAREVAVRAVWIRGGEIVYLAQSVGMCVDGTHCTGSTSW